jgi:hypothetical protein
MHFKQLCDCVTSLCSQSKIKWARWYGPLQNRFAACHGENEILFSLFLPRNFCPPPLCAYLCYAVVSKQNFNWFTLLNTNFDEKFKLFDRTIKSLKKRLRFKGQSHEKVCEVMIWDVSFGLKSLPTVCKILNRMIKSYDFSNRVALDVRPVSLICRFCGAPQDRTADCHNTLQKNRLFRRTVPFNKKQNPVKKQRLRMSKHCIFQLTVFWYI